MKTFRIFMLWILLLSEVISPLTQAFSVDEWEPVDIITLESQGGGMIL